MCWEEEGGGRDNEEGMAPGSCKSLEVSAISQTLSCWAGRSYRVILYYLRSYLVSSPGHEILVSSSITTITQQRATYLHSQPRHLF